MEYAHPTAPTVEMAAPPDKPDAIDITCKTITKHIPHMIITKNPSLYAGSPPDALAPALVMLESIYDPTIFNIAAVKIITKQKLRH